MSAIETPEPDVITSWQTSSTPENDRWLRNTFRALLTESAELPPEERLIMYDADDDFEVRESLGVFRKRLDARRNTKPKKPDEQRLVCTPFNADGFHFGKIRNDRERIVKLGLGAGRYDVLTNKFPLFPKHMLLVAKSLVPQQMTGTHLRAICELQRASSFCAYFNSWCASASVNHFHCHLIDEFPPVTAFPLVPGPVVMGARCLQPQGFPGFCYVFPKASAFPFVDVAVQAMQQDNQPHNLLFTPRFIYVFPKPLARPQRSFDLYPETVGGPELIGSFTVYSEDIYSGLQPEHVDELCRINTCPLPSRLLQHAVSAVGLRVSDALLAPMDDTTVTETATVKRARLDGRTAIAPSRTADLLPMLPPIAMERTPSLHTEDWPQDRPIARALTSNINQNSLV